MRKYLVHNDFHSSHGIFELFEGLAIENMDDPLAITQPLINGSVKTNALASLNGLHKVPDGSAQHQVLN